MKQIKTITKHNWFISLIKGIIRRVREEPKLILHDDNLPEKKLFILLIIVVQRDR
jgi:hypothetical protein